MAKGRRVEVKALPACADDKPEGPLCVGGIHEVPRNAEPIRMPMALAEAKQIVAAALPDVSRALADQAKAGSVNHLKLFLEIAGLLKGGLGVPEETRREKNLEEILNEQWEKEIAE
jgi:hypothetical protein